MNRVLAVNGEDLTATVEAGVTRKQLNAAIEDTGLFFPVDPGADATLGGMAATRASGSNAVRYGTMRENVLGLRVVTADGEVIRTAGRAKKSSAGYDLTRIFVGSEGTLGIITEVTVRLYPQPEAVSAAVCPFPDVAGAVDTVIRTIQRGVPIARAELLDALTVTAVNRYSKTELKEQPTLFLEFHGTPSGVEEQAETVQEIAREHGGHDFEWAVDPEDRARLWDARHTAFLACLQLRPGARAFVTDACVPISRLAECIAATIEDTRASSLPCPILGHVGDGNFHCIILADPANPAEMEEAERLNQRVMRRALAMDGTCTGEHGVGMHKISLLGEEFGDAGRRPDAPAQGGVGPAEHPESREGRHDDVSSPRWAGRPRRCCPTQGESRRNARRERSMIDRPGSPTQQVSEWLSRFGAALDRKDRAAAAELFGDECYWRDLVSFTWNIKTLEGKDEIQAMLAATICRRAARSTGRSWERPTEENGVTAGWFTFETAVARGKGYLRLKAGQCWTLLTTMTELKGFEEKQGPTRVPGAQHGVFRNRKTWLERKTQEEAELGYATQPYCVIIGGGQGGIGLAARLKRLEVPTIIIEKNSSSRRFVAESLQVALPARPRVVRPPALPAVSRPLAGVLAEGQDRRLAGDVRQGHGAELLAFHRMPRRQYHEDTQDWTVTVEREGETVVLRPRQLVLATGMSGMPNVPQIPGPTRSEGRSSIPASSAASTTTAARSASSWAPTIRLTTSVPLCGSRTRTSP